MQKMNSEHLNWFWKRLPGGVQVYRATEEGPHGVVEHIVLESTPRALQRFEQGLLR